MAVILLHGLKRLPDSSPSLFQSPNYHHGCQVVKTFSAQHFRLRYPKVLKTHFPFGLQDHCYYRRQWFSILSRKKTEPCFYCSASFFFYISILSHQVLKILVYILSICNNDFLDCFTFDHLCVLCYCCLGSSSLIVVTYRPLLLFFL